MQHPLTRIVECKPVFFQPRSCSSAVTPEGGIPRVQLDGLRVKMDSRREAMTWTPIVKLLWFAGRGTYL